MEELERLSEIYGEIADRARMAVVFGWVIVVICAIGSTLCFREAYLSWKMQKVNERKLEELRNRKDGSYFFYSSKSQKV